MMSVFDVAKMTVTNMCDKSIQSWLFVKNGNTTPIEQAKLEPGTE